LFLERCHAERLGVEQALEVLARVHETLAAQDPVGIDQRGPGQARDAESEAERLREDVGKVAEPLLSDERFVFLTGPVAREDHAQARLSRQRAEHGEQRATHRAARREEDQQRTMARAADRDGVAVEALGLDPGRGLSRLRPTSESECADRAEACVQHTDLAGECQHHQGKRDHHDPEHEVRDDERLAHDATGRANRASVAR
jgi:hypothetical protein